MYWEKKESEYLEYEGNFVSDKFEGRGLLKVYDSEKK